jgi:hypothetical protein
MRLVEVQEFVDKYHKTLLLISLLFVFVVDAYVISQCPLHLSDGVSSTWWMIILLKVEGLRRMSRVLQNDFDVNLFCQISVLKNVILKKN